LARSFGVICESPTLYAYFACSIRNRLEVLDSPRFHSPTVGIKHGDEWLRFPHANFSVGRPTKLVDGSRGGQAFMAEFLRPAGQNHYSIADQSRLQLLSVLLVGAGLTNEDFQSKYVEEILPRDFDVAAGLGSVFTRLLEGLVIATCAAVALLLATGWSLIKVNLFGDALPYMVKLVSLFNWAVGATGLLMLGGNPRVRVATKSVPDHISKRLKEMSEHAGGHPTTQNPDSKSPQQTITEVGSASAPPNDPLAGEAQSKIPQHVEKPLADGTCGEDNLPSPTPDHATQPILVHDPIVEIRFGSLHGSIFTSDGGSCSLPLSLVTDITRLDIVTVRSIGWYVGFAWFSLLLLAGLALQIGSSFAPSLGADLFGLGFLLVTALARGVGVAGPEEWTIPMWKRRAGAIHGASLLGQLQSRTDTEA
jgi:hypothetical protein